MPFPSFEDNAWQTGYAMYPLDSPGLPLPGSDFIDTAVACGDEPPVIEGKGKNKKLATHGDCLQYLMLRALYDPQFSMPVNVKGTLVDTPFVVGHIWGDEPGGPRQADVMVIGKHPGSDEIAKRRNFEGSSSADLYRALDELQVPHEETDNWYVTNLVRHNKLDPASNTLASAWINNCLPLLHQELRLVRPKYILCLGSDAGKGVLGGKGAVTQMLGQVIDYEFPVHLPGEAVEVHSAKLMVVTHPSAVFHNPEKYDELMHGLAQFMQLVRGNEVGRTEDDVNHFNIYTERMLSHVVDQIINDPDPASRVIAVDCEWEGQNPNDEGAYLRTVQFSHKAKTAYTIVLHNQDGTPVFRPGPARAFYHLKRLLQSTPDREVRVGGHFFSSDLPWLLYHDIDVRAEHMPYVTGDDDVDIEATRTHGGWDTGAMAHAYCETANFELETQGVRYTTVPRYDLELSKWKAAYCKLHGLGAKQLTGYGACPDEVLHHPISRRQPNYACYDADTTRRLFDVYNGINGEPGLLDSDRFKLNSRRAYLTTMKARCGFLEMEMNGITIDTARGDELTTLYMSAQSRLLSELRRDLQWEDQEKTADCPGWKAFNPGSVVHVRELLYGVKYNGAKSETGEPRRVSPPHVELLNLQPIKATGKGAQPWDRIRHNKQEHLFSPSTDRETVGILAHASPVLAKLRDLKFIRQVLIGSLRPPAVDKKTKSLVLDDDGNMVYEKGLLSHVDWDGRVRTHFYPVETGRVSSSRPNLQNISSRREADYKRILQDLYKYPIRSMFRASPGCVLVEVDLKSAELAVMAWMSGDPTMIEHVRRNMLPENHPDYLDIHSSTAVRAFHLDCEPTKAGLEAVGKKHLRVAAKNVNFGIPYQRGAEAIQRQCREEGTFIEIAEAEQLKVGYFETYPMTDPFLEECKQCARDPGYMIGAYGRARRFSHTDDHSVQAKMEREACNFGIQNGVADNLALAIYNLVTHRNNHRGPEWFDLLMQIHDSLLFEVEVKHLDWLVEDIIPRCMTSVPFVPCYLDGTPHEIDEPFYFGADASVYLYWGQSIKAAEGKALGIPDKYLSV